MTAEYVDVLICGGGPAGLVTGLALARMGITTVIVGERMFSKC
jgi:phenol 2-monooxygenase (NADPH)